MAGRPTADVDVLGILWRHRLGLLVAVLIGAATGAALSQLQPVAYTAESRVFLSVASSFDPLNLRPTSANTEQRFVVQQAELLASRPVLDRVEAPEGVDFSDPDAFLDVSGSADSELLVVRATAANPADAAALADAVPAAYQQFVLEQLAQDVERAVAGAISDPEQAQEIRLAAALYDDGVAVVERAGVPTQPSQPATVRNIVALAILLGLAYATIVVVLRTTRERRSDIGRSAVAPEDDGGGGTEKATDALARLRKARVNDQGTGPTSSSADPDGVSPGATQASRPAGVADADHGDGARG